MIDAWHLVWIVPIVATLSYALGAWLATGKMCDEQDKQEQAKQEQADAWPAEDKCSVCPFRPERRESK